MPIVTSELALCYAARRNQANPAANGGRPTATAIRCGQAGNVWPPLTAAQRAAGETRAEKLFWANRNAADEVGADPWIALAQTTSGDEYEWIVAADQDGMQSDLTGSERRWTAARLAADAAVGATSLSILLPHAALSGCFQAGDAILLHAGGETWEECAVATVAGSGAALTLTLSAGTRYAWAANTASCCGLYRPGHNLAPRVDNITQSGAGSYDFATYPLGLGNLGTIRQDWTLTYTAATTLEVSGDTLGSLGGFATDTEIAPLDASGRPYFRLAAEGHGTAHVTGDEIRFSTWAAAAGFWLFRVVPAGAPAQGTTVTGPMVKVESI